MPGAGDVLLATTGDGEGAPDPAAARGLLDAAGVDMPVPLTIAVDPGRYGAESRAEYEELAAQLESGGLFTVKLVTVRSDDLGKRHGPMTSYSAQEGGWSPRGTDPAVYRAPYLVGAGQLATHDAAPASLALLAAPATEASAAKRSADLRLAQQVLAGELPVVPLLQESQLAAIRDGVTGVRFDGSFTLRFGSLVLP
jgi:peptide/nickel transport system substrate-binding protein